jgi:hypothetical protein
MADTNQQGQWLQHMAYLQTEYDQGSSRRQTMTLSPVHLFNENMPSVDPSILDCKEPAFDPEYVPTSGVSFAEQANAIINETLGRQPVGTSVV